MRMLKTLLEQSSKKHSRCSWTNFTNTYFQVLNAKDYGIPQNRERVYLIIVLKELDNGKFKFPLPFESSIRLKDVLEDEVDEKYYINTPTAQKLIDDLVESGKLDKEISNTVRAGGEEV